MIATFLRIFICWSGLCIFLFTFKTMVSLFINTVIIISNYSVWQLGDIQILAMKLNFFLLIYIMICHGFNLRMNLRALICLAQLHKQKLIKHNKVSFNLGLGMLVCCKLVIRMRCQHKLLRHLKGLDCYTDEFVSDHHFHRSCCKNPKQTKHPSCR